MSFVDSICVKLLNNSLLLYGKGNQLILKTGAENCVINKTRPYDKIHQISFIELSEDHYQVVCSAGREILCTELEDKKFKSTFITKINDWISSIKILDDGSVAILTSHNLAALMKQEGSNLVIKNKLRCDENSTLYCSHINGTSWDDLLFFTGTALGELVIWRKEEDEPKIIHRQFLHNGVIFSIDYNGKYLVTSSDDRSIKVFDAAISNGSTVLRERKQLFGHTSRVFVCKIIEYDNQIKFLSAGEDSNLCVWSETGNLLSKKNVSTSGVIWNLDYDAASETVVTCSSTGKLNKFCLRKILFEKHEQININLDQGVQPARLKYLKNGALIVLDNKMQIHMKLPQQSWMRIKQPVNSQKFVAMENFKNRLFFAAKSSIVVFDFDEKLQELVFTVELEVTTLLPPAIKLDFLRSIHAVNTDEVFISDASGLCCVIDISQNKILNLLQIPRSSEPWTTAVAKAFDFWLVADRVGNLFVYENTDDSFNIASPKQKLWKIHGQLGVTTIRVEKNGFVKTTGNDGTMKTLFLDRKNHPPTIEIHQCEKTSVNWIEKVCVWADKEYLLGFNDNYFTIYHKREIIYEFSCGGRHRNWDVILVDGERVNFVYIKKKQLNIVQFMLNDFNYDSNEVDWHTKECNAIANADNGKLLISGGEDTIIKVMQIRADDGKAVFREIANINSHISSIKAFATEREGNDLRVFSVGGRAQIVVTRLIEMKHVKEETNFMLFTIRNENATFDPETRFTDLAYCSASSNLHVACSDGFIRIFKFTKNDENAFVLLMITKHLYGRCLLKIHVLGEFVLTMATDGFVCFWVHNESARSIKLIAKLKHNQNGINCFDIYKLSESTFRIATSGDDAGVFITDFTVSPSTKVEFGETLSTYNVHIAQVTGLKFTSSNFLYTTSVDQTICKLEVTKASINVLDRKFTCISDVKGFSFINDKSLVVFGAGLEVLHNILS